MAAILADHGVAAHQSRCRGRALERHAPERGGEETVGTAAALEQELVVPLRRKAQLEPDAIGFAVGAGARVDDAPDEALRADPAVLPRRAGHCREGIGLEHLRPLPFGPFDPRAGKIDLCKRRTGACECCRVRRAPVVGLRLTLVVAERRSADGQREESWNRMLRKTHWLNLRFSDLRRGESRRMIETCPRGLDRHSSEDRRSRRRARLRTPWDRSRSRAPVGLRNANAAPSRPGRRRRIEALDCLASGRPSWDATVADPISPLPRDTSLRLFKSGMFALRSSSRRLSECRP